MTLNTLLGNSADELDKLTDAEIKAFFAPYLTTTRPTPEMAKRQGKIGEVKQVTKAKKQLAMSKLEKLFEEKMGKKLFD